MALSAQKRNPPVLRPADESSDLAQMFELAPVSLWLEDFSGVKALFDSWRAAGITDIRQHLLADPAAVRACSERIRVIKVNRRTLTLFEADDLPHLIGNLVRVFRDDMLTTHIEELAQLAEGKRTFASQTVNYTLSGRRIDINLKGTVLPGYEDSLERVLIAIEDVSDRERARRGLAENARYAQGLFQHSPVSLWVEDFSAVKELIDDVRDRGIDDFRVFLDVHPEFVQRCVSEIRVIDVNRRTLEMFAAPDKGTLLYHLGDVFRDDMQRSFKEQLIDLWNGKLFQTREVVNYALDGTELHVLLQFSVLPGHEDDWSLVQVALSDITARKKAEAYLEFLGKHDTLTKLYNRSFYVDELNRLDRKMPHPVSIIIADLNDLKTANDSLGHAVGDTLLRRVGEVLAKAVDAPNYAARIGGDEFALLLPSADEAGAAQVVQSIHALVELNNQYYSSVPLSLSMGVATGAPGERMEDIARRADALMYEEKRKHHALRRNNRASDRASAAP